MTIEDTLRTLIREELLAFRRDLLADLRRTLVLPPNTPQYLTTEEAAELARVTPRTVRDWVKTGVLRERRAGAKLLIQTAELHAHLAGDLLPDEELVVARELARIGVR